MIRSYFEQVSWLIHRHTQLLTVGRMTYTADQRVSSIHKPASEDWVLEIRKVTAKDQGGREEKTFSGEIVKV